MTHEELIATLKDREPSEYNKSLLRTAIEHTPQDIYGDNSRFWCEGCDEESPCWELEELKLGILRAYL